MIKLKNKEIKIYRDKILEEQGGICPLTGKKIVEGKAVLDHQHSLKNEELGKQGAGCIRGVLDFRANSFEGKILYWFKRLGVSKFISLPLFLRNLAEYLEKDTYPLIHPSEIKPKKLTKVCYNKLVKVAGDQIPPYPKSKKLTKKLNELFIEHDVKITYYKDK